ncbi:MAG: S8 family serine peptidase [Myxococcota bacterium]
MHTSSHLCSVRPLSQVSRWQKLASASSALFGLTLSLTVLAPAQAEAGTAAVIVQPQLAEFIQQNPTGTLFVYLRERADVDVYQKLSSIPERRRAVVKALQETASRSQKGLAQELTRRGMPYTSYYVVNALQVPANTALVEWLKTRPEVERIDANRSFLMLDHPVEERNVSAVAAGVEWNVTAIKAPTVWLMGYTGKGIVVAGADTGVDWTHSAIKKQYRGYSAASGGATHAYNWYDGTTRARQDAPYDDHGHGTFTVGEMVGDDGNGNQIGAAPGATWIACKNMNSSGVGTVESYTRCFQWFIAPTDSTGQNPNPELAPDVVNNSWGCPSSEGCTKETLHDIVKNVQAAGVMLIFSAGNSGPSCSTVMDPPATFPEVMSVGAVDSSGSIASFSSRGPTTYDRSLKPNISAPGQGVRSCMPGGGYSSMSGTSMAAPLVAAGIALVWSADPVLKGDISTTWTTLTNTATAKRAPKCGGEGAANNIYGYGNLNVKAAVDAALATP